MSVLELCSQVCVTVSLGTSQSSRAVSILLLSCPANACLHCGIFLYIYVQQFPHHVEEGHCTCKIVHVHILIKPNCRWHGHDRWFIITSSGIIKMMTMATPNQKDGRSIPFVWLHEILLWWWHKKLHMTVMSMSDWLIHHYIRFLLVHLSFHSLQTKHKSHYQLWTAVTTDYTLTEITANFGPFYWFI